jgi:gamma-glutamylcyclotransferase (GGCT)/AIG2-like uncharacterized protein YtfP
MLDSQEETRGAEHLFVYGTLMHGGRLHHLLHPSPSISFAGRGRIRAQLYRLQGEAYPGAVPTADADRFVHGEVYRLGDPGPTLQRLDEAEGCDEGLFARHEVEVFLDNATLRAWTYFYDRPLAGAEPIADGRFLPGQALA